MKKHSNKEGLYYYRENPMSTEAMFPDEARIAMAEDSLPYPNWYRKEIKKT